MEREERADGSAGDQGKAVQKGGKSRGVGEDEGRGDDDGEEKRRGASRNRKSRRTNITTRRASDGSEAGSESFVPSCSFAVADGEVARKFGGGRVFDGVQVGGVRAATV